MEVRDTKPNIRIATSGFSYDDWVGPVYPKGTAKGNMLQYYSTELGFDMVELNYTYYTQPSARGVEGLLENSPDDFEFVVKAHRSMTHDIRDRDGAYIRDEGAVAAFLAGLEPMIEAGRLKCVLAQFPLKFRKDDGAIEHLKWLRDKTRSVRLAVELRDRSWMAQSVFDMLRSYGITYCAADGPPLEPLAPFTPVTTSSMAYFRLHGRNIKWFNVPSNVRYDYRYSREELRQLVTPIRNAASRVKETLVFFNNHFQGSAVANARELRELLETT